jgi:hypothetical protein
MRRLSAADVDGLSFFLKANNTTSISMRTIVTIGHHLKEELNGS